MLDPSDLWLLEDEAPLDQPAEVLQTMPELRLLADPDPDDDELGLRSILEDPDVLSKAWRRSVHAERRPRSSKSLKRHPDVLAPRTLRPLLRPQERGPLDSMRVNT